MRIDSHQHFWKYDPMVHSWMDDSMKSIQRDFLPYDLKPILEETGFDGCIAVQASQTETENSFLLSFAHQNNFIKGIVGWVDLQSNNIIDRLDHYSQFQKIKGFRHILQDEPDIDFMLHPSFINGISKLNQYGFTYDILIYPDHLPNAFTLAKSFPNQLFVIDHLAKPKIKKQEIANWSKQIKKIAALENVFCKVSGMVTESDWNNWKEENFKPYLDIVLDAFGIERLMYGSDWPVCTLSSSYQNTLKIVREYFSKLSFSEQELFFGGNATSFYNLDVM
ncbi:amidohydrolase family protein [Aquiflexum gelatinilyticum]|uniref:Amidohydrolase family protein n=1 Tax=Aquiflexum gelatinilyticum TaxID=2961943 RepID=A0A9X2PA22_9BACT|nr:amidohydrolase family protein [Aquiflexum gelatinilyticum]MCR9016605.1 amidohydrolase family protein [Aquiflexum gelatinilyticum]